MSSNYVSLRERTWELSQELVKQFRLRRKAGDYSFGFGLCCYVTFLISWKTMYFNPLFHSSAKGARALASTVFFLVTVVSNIVIYWWPYPVAEILPIPQFRLSVYRWLPQALQFPI